MPVRASASAAHDHPPIPTTQIARLSKPLQRFHRQRRAGTWRWRGHTYAATYDLRIKGEVIPHTFLWRRPDSERVIGASVIANTTISR